MSLTSARRVFQRGRRDERGSVIVEYAALAPVIIFLTVGLFEASMLMSVRALLDTSAREGARFGITGAVVQGETREETIRDIISDRAGVLVQAAALNVSLESYESFEQLAGSPDAGVPGPGNANDVVVYTVTYLQPLMTPYIEGILGIEHVAQSARVVVQNEPF